MLGRISPRYFYALGALILVVGLVLGVAVRDSSVPAVAAREPDAAMQRLAALMARTSGRPSFEELSAFESSNGGTRAAALARFLRGYLAADSQDWARALAALDAGEIEQRTALADYALFYKGRALVELGRPADAERFLSRVAKEHEDSLLARDATIAAARAAVAAANLRRAAEVLEPLVEANDAEALMIAGDLASGRGETSAAIGLYRRAYFLDPAAPAAAGAAGQLRALGVDVNSLSGSLEEMTARADRLFAAEQWRAAADAYGRVLAAHPSGGNRDELQLRRGAAASNARDAATAEASLPLVSSRNPERQAEALYHLALAYRRSARPAQYEETVARLRTAHPKSAWTGRLLADYAEYLDDKNRLAERIAVQRALIAGFPTNDKAAEASYDLAWNAYKTGDYRGAAEGFGEHLATFRTPTTKWIGEAAFWGGRAWERLGNLERAAFFYTLAAERYPFGYHGHVAKNRLASLTRRAQKVVPEQPAEGSRLAAARENALAVQPISETADDRVEPRFRRAGDLEAIALWELAAGELAAAQRVFPTSPRVALRYAQTFRARGDNYQATLMLRRGYPDVYSYRDDQMPREAWEIMFPLTNWDAIKRHAEANGLDPFVVAGLIRQESVFNPKALSRANARGLMQLLPSTGRLVARSRGLGAVGPADLYNPTLNITLGTAYLSEQLGKFGRIELAAAAYNAGPGRVVQWKAQRPVEPIEEWVENIPISETRGYVQGVIRYAANYRRFYGRGAEREGSN
jgi:soluble lytic murein transglycosylase